MASTLPPILGVNSTIKPADPEIAFCSDPAPGQYDVDKCCKTLEPHVPAVSFGRVPKRKSTVDSDGPAPGDYNVDKCMKVLNQRKAPATFSREQRRAATPRAESPSPGQYNVDSCWKSIEKPK